MVRGPVKPTGDQFSHPIRPASNNLYRHWAMAMKQVLSPYRIQTTLIIANRGLHLNRSSLSPSGPTKRPRPFLTCIRLDACNHAHLSTFASKHFRVQDGDVERLLKRFNLHYTINHPKNIAVVKVCPFCHDTKGQRDNFFKLNIFLDSGGYKCFRCCQSGSWFDLRRNLKPSSLSVTPPTTHTTPVSSPPDPSLHSHHRHALRSELSNVKTYLNSKRGITDDVLDAFGVGATTVRAKIHDSWTEYPSIAFPMYNDDGQLVRHKLRAIENKSVMRLAPTGGTWGLFGLNNVPPDANEVVLTEGEFDAMAVYQSTGRPAVSVPNGANSLPVDVLQMLERFETIYLWMDADAAGSRAVEQFARKIGIQRCRVVASKGCKDANEGLLKGLDLSQMIERADFIPHGSIVSFESIRERIRSRLFDGSKGTPSVSIPSFNDHITGLRNGELSIFTGHTGIGKTTLLCQLSLDYCMQGVPTLWGSFEMDNGSLGKILMTQFRNAHTENYKSLKDDFDEWADRFSKLPMYFMTHHGSCDMNEVLDAMDYANYRYDCKHVVIDNLQFMLGRQAYGADRFAVYDHAISELRSFCTTRNTHVSLVIHPRKEDDGKKIGRASVFGSAKATQEADNVIALHYLNVETGHKLEVLKNRFEGLNNSRKGLYLRFDKKRRLFQEQGGHAVPAWANKVPCLNIPLIDVYDGRSADADGSSQSSRHEEHFKHSLDAPTTDGLKTDVYESDLYARDRVAEDRTNKDMSELFSTRDKESEEHLESGNPTFRNTGSVSSHDSRSNYAIENAGNHQKGMCNEYHNGNKTKAGKSSSHGNAFKRDRGKKKPERKSFAVESR